MIYPLRIKLARELRGLSHQELAARIPFATTGDIQKWERAEAKPADTQLTWLAQAMNLPRVFFQERLTGEDLWDEDRSTLRFHVEIPDDDD